MGFGSFPHSMLDFDWLLLWFLGILGLRYDRLLFGGVPDAPGLIPRLPISYRITTASKFRLNSLLRYSCLLFNLHYDNLQKIVAFNITSKSMLLRELGKPMMDSSFFLYI